MRDPSVRFVMSVVTKTDGGKCYKPEIHFFHEGPTGDANM